MVAQARGPPCGTCRPARYARSCARPAPCSRCCPTETRSFPSLLTAQFCAGTCASEGDRAAGPESIANDLTPDGQYHVVRRIGASASLRDTRTGKSLGTLNDLPRKQQVVFSPDGKTLAILAEGNVLLYDPVHAKGHGNFGTLTGNLCFSPGGDFCVAEVGTRTEERQFTTRVERVTVDGLKIWDLAAGREVSQIKGRKGRWCFLRTGGSLPRWRAGRAVPTT